MKCLNCGNTIPDDSVFCPRCGSDTRLVKSSDAGRVEEKKKSHITIVLGVLSVILIITTVFLVVDDIEMHKTKDDYVAENEELNQRIQELNDEVNNQTEELLEANEQIEKLQKQYSSIRNTLDTTDRLKSKLSRALSYVVFVGPDDYYYHKWDCDRLDMSEFYAFNTEYAIGEGYVPCPHCIE